jgi:hypothetical protein
MIHKWAGRTVAVSDITRDVRGRIELQIASKETP